MKTFKQHISETHSYMEYHLHDGKKIILKNPTMKNGIVSGLQVISRQNTGTVHGTKDAITKHHLIGANAIKKEIPLKHDLTYDELIEK